MLSELRVENLLLIERAHLRLAPGLNVLTGETGSGKTVLAHALDLLLGGRPRSGIVRPGAAEAYVEGTFELPAGLPEALGGSDAAWLEEDAEEVVLARRVSAAGRTRAYLNGRSAPVADLQRVAAELLTFYGQHEHRRLTLASAQLDLLDAFCGAGHVARRAGCARQVTRVRRLERATDELRATAGARERELDLLAFELAEIEDAAPDPAERERLAATRERLRHVEALRGAALGAAEAAAPEEGMGAVALLAAGGAALDAQAGVDPALDALAERWRVVALEAEDLAGELRRYADGVEADAEGEVSLEALEERLAVLHRLERKHGGSIEAVLAHAERCRARREELAGADDRLEAAAGELEAARAELAETARALRAGRAQAAPELAEAVRERLAGLAMEGATFAIELGEREDGAIGPGGADAVEFLIAPNAGVPAAALRDTASGGELSRVMLALLGVANDGSSATLVFDEVDAGIGGQTARVVGEQLRSLAEGRQVVCITHLPQIASLAQRHFSIEKDGRAEPARTAVRELDGGEVVAELVRMLGASADDVAARRHARELLRAA